MIVLPRVFGSGVCGWTHNYIRYANTRTVYGWRRQGSNLQGFLTGLAARPVFRVTDNRSWSRNLWSRYVVTGLHPKPVITLQKHGFQPKTRARVTRARLLPWLLLALGPVSRFTGPLIFVSEPVTTLREHGSCSETCATWYKNGSYLATRFCVTIFDNTGYGNKLHIILIRHVIT